MVTYIGYKNIIIGNDLFAMMPFLLTVAHLPEKFFRSTYDSPPGLVFFSSLTGFCEVSSNKRYVFARIFVHEDFVKE